MSTLPSQPAPQPPWKQEVNKRLAAHRNRNGSRVDGREEHEETETHLHGRAAEAAARVAERYAKAPSYSEMQAAEAMAALRAAETATRAALEAQTAAQMALAGLEMADEDPEPSRELELLPSEVDDVVPDDGWQLEAAEVPVVSRAGQELEIRWDPEMPTPPTEPPPAPAACEQRQLGTAEDGWWGATDSDDGLSAPSIQQVEPEKPIHANLIEFPRELVATRRMRPRLTNASRTAIGDLFGQLSIFEVDPSSISTEPEAPEPAVEVPEETEEWNGPRWSGIELDEEPAIEDLFLEELPAGVPELQQAPFLRRFLAGTVDASFIAGLVAALGFAAADRLPQPVTMKAAELGAIAALIAIGILYEGFFLMLMRTTPGMMWARISLITVDEEIPTRAQMRGRLGALMLSLLPVGLGVMWAVFDDDHLTWHDRLSRTYQRLD